MHLDSHLDRVCLVTATLKGSETLEILVQVIVLKREETLSNPG